MAVQVVGIGFLVSPIPICVHALTDPLGISVDVPAACTQRNRAAPCAFSCVWSGIATVPTSVGSIQNSYIRPFGQIYLASLLHLANNCVDFHIDKILGFCTATESI